MTITFDRIETLAPMSDQTPLLTTPGVSTTQSSSSALKWLVFVAAIGGFLFGYDTGVISGALPYIRDDLLLPDPTYSSDSSKLASVQELIVSSAIIAAAISCIFGGWLGDALGRKTSLLLADLLFTLGALAMSLAPGVAVLICGRVMIGLGIGIASVVVPIYISECSSTAAPGLRGRLIVVNVFMITGGQFAAYLVNYCFTFVGGGGEDKGGGGRGLEWRLMLGAAALPSMLQLVGLVRLSESPLWLASKGRHHQARRARALLQGDIDGNQESADVSGLQERMDQQDDDDEYDEEDRRSSDGKNKAPTTSFLPSWNWMAQLTTKPVLKSLHIGIGLQILQQTTGINTIMYFTPTILQMAGFNDNKTALLWSLIPAGVNALGTLIGAGCIDRYGRRRLLLGSLLGVSIALSAMGGAFRLTETHSPPVTVEGSTCVGSGVRDCSACLEIDGCGYCGSVDFKKQYDLPGTCIVVHKNNNKSNGSEQCGEGSGDVELFTVGCPSKYSYLVLLGMLLYLAAFSPGLGPVPWTVNAEIYPMAVRGVCMGIAATSNWVANALVASTFLTMFRLVGGSGVFWLYGVVAVVGMVWVGVVLPETRGLSLEEIQGMLNSVG